MNKQRIYDAMLIKAFRADVRMTDLEWWLKPYDIKLKECNLKRIPKYVKWNMRVQSMVGAYLKPLADKLWDNDKSKDIEILNWMQEIDMGKQWVDRQREKTRKDSNNARRKTYILAESIAINRLSNQWKVTK